MQRIFVSGIGTDVGKTVVAAVLTEALQADYWKPVQAGDLHNSDTHKVQRLISNAITVFHPSAYALQTPMSPHGAAAIDGIEIDLKEIIRPKTKNHLVIEGAGGLLVPLNNKDTVIDIAQTDDHVVLVSRHYLGSINHSLLSLELLKARGFKKVSLIFSGDEHPTTENIITTMHPEVPVIGRIDDEPYIDQRVVAYYADKFKSELK
ncbi:dethiobiotin synthase [Gilvibacter sediminis]|uniref:dethiobiotin synthase n=1 Tax=Gilvibacter sediminis TaxID=379071 RepID=UPI00234FFCD3|nr:dethiobiotin synthase [Gilvibacter sediminis]MDC7997138.1 dethiobiotin synthase [Gilvibacter sediminis]